MHFSLENSDRFNRNRTDQNAPLSEDFWKQSIVVFVIDSFQQRWCHLNHKKYVCKSLSQEAPPRKVSTYSSAFNVDGEKGCENDNVDAKHFARSGQNALEWVEPDCNYSQRRIPLPHPGQLSLSVVRSPLRLLYYQHEDLTPPCQE